MNSRKRVIIGISLLVATFFITLHEGAIGHILARVCGFLFGQTGTAVLAVAMFLIGTVLILPRDFLGRFIRWGVRGREARVDRVRREMIAHERRAAVPEPIEVEEAVKTPIPPAHRMRLDDVRGALRQLGYKTPEFDGLVKAMDPTVPFEVLVKGALKKLQEKRN